MKKIEDYVRKNGIEPCPFCGSESVCWGTNFSLSFQFPLYNVSCWKCGAMVSSAFPAKTGDEGVINVIKIWNRRAKNDKQRKAD